MSKLEYISSALDPFVVPQHYDIFIEPDLTEMRSRGKVEIDLSINEHFNGRSISINCTNTVCIVDAILSYKGINPKTYSLVETSFNLYYETQKLYFVRNSDEELPKGEAKLTIWFSSRINQNTGDGGLYRISLNGSDGEHEGLCTQFEPCGARQMIPCFDEPAIRTTFQLSVMLPKDLICASNTPIQSQNQGYSKTITTFEKTISMSTYLLAFVAGKFDKISKTVELNDGVSDQTKMMTINVLIPPGMSEKGQQALTWACNAVTYLTKAFQCFLPLEKLDLAGVPLDGLGMENFGLLTFRTEYFLIDSETPVARRNRICLLILHEVSHLWFGDMVTIKWWKYLYLKEGFARLLEYSIASILYPEVEWWKHFIATHLGPCKVVDATPSRIHPVEVPVHRGIDSENIFDLISYSKGASVLRMACDMVGNEAFFKALPALINKNLYGSIETKDLWQSFSTSTGKDFSTMDSWVKHEGHPIIDVDMTRNKETKTIRLDLTQEIHLMFAPEQKINAIVDAEGDVAYPIPLMEIKIIDENGKIQMINEEMLSHEKTILIKNVEGDIEKAIVLLNPNQRGFFAVRYPESMWHQFIDAIEASNQFFSRTEILGFLIEAGQSKNHTPADVWNRLLTYCKNLGDEDINAYITRCHS